MCDYKILGRVSAGDVEYVLGQNMTKYGSAYCVWEFSPRYEPHYRCETGFGLLCEAKKNMLERAERHLELLKDGRCHYYG